MSATDSVTRWLHALQDGDQAVAQNLWQNYFQRLVELARKRLRGTTRDAADEEDVAVSAFASFCRGAGRGRFPQLHDRDDLWRLLVIITARMAMNLVKYVRRQKRGGGRVLGEAALAGALPDSTGGADLGQFPDPEPTPAFAAQVAEECRRLLARLEEGELRAVALWKMEGYTTEEIAAKLDCVPRTVDRKLRRIRTIWGHTEGGR
jgi:DNA-directed RNA polymerase specialized sigma24 family protein